MKLLIVTQKVDENDQLLGFFIEWLRRLAGKLDRLTVLCLEKGEYNLPANVNVVLIGKYRGIFRFVYLFRFYYLILKLRKEYDGVFVHMNPIWMAVGGPLWRLMKKKRFLWYTTKGVTLKLKIAEKFAERIFTASSESFRIKSKKVIVTGHGIDTQIFKPNPKSEIRNPKQLKILSVGRISPVKNYETLIDAAKILRDNGVDFGVTMIGEPALDSDKRYLESLKFKVKSLKLEDNFDFVGKINHKDLPGYYQSHDIFVHLSKTGSLDKAILEAMACRMNVLSSNDASRGFLSPDLIFDQDDPIDLANKIRNSGTSKAQNNLRQYVIDNHDLDNLIDKIYNKYVPEIIIYPFPYSSKSNKYIDLLYSHIENKEYVSDFRKLFFRKPGIIHIHWTNVIYGSRFILKTIFLMALNFTILGILKMKGFKIVWTKHNYYPHDSRWIWLDKIGQKVIFNLANAVTVHQKNEVKGKKIFYIPHGNYIDAYGPMKNKETKGGNAVLLSLGAIKPYKKIDNVIKAFDKAGADNAELLIAGKCDEGYGKKLKKLIGNNANIKLDCHFVPDDQIPEHLANADYSIFWYDDSVLTSGGIILSLSYGIPVIARNIPAADLIRDNENGFLFDNEKELEEIIRRLASVSEFDRNKVQNTVRHLGWPEISDEFLKLYHSLWAN